MFNYFSISEKEGGKNIYLRKSAKQYSKNDIDLVSIVELKTRNNSDFAKSFLSDNSLNCLRRLKNEFKEPVLNFYSSEMELFNNFKFTPNGGYTSYDLIKIDIIPNDLTLIKEIPYISKGTRKNVKSKKNDNLYDLMIKDIEIKRISILNESLDKKIDYKKFSFIEELSTKSMKGQWRSIAFTYEDFKHKIFYCDIQSFKESVFTKEFLILFKSKLRIFQEEILPTINKKGTLNIDFIEFIDMKVEVAINKIGLKISNIKVKCKYTNNYYIYSRTALVSGMLLTRHKRDLTLNGSEASPLIKRLLLVAQDNGKDIKDLVIKEIKLKNKKFHSIVFEKNGKLYLEHINSFQENKNLEKEILNKEGEIEALHTEIKELNLINKVKKVFIKVGINLTEEELSYLKLIKVNKKYYIKFILFTKEFTCIVSYLEEKLKIILDKAKRTTKTYIGMGINTFKIDNENIEGPKIGSTNRFEGKVLERKKEIERVYTFKFNDSYNIICIPGNHETRIRNFIIDKTVNKEVNLYSGVKNKIYSYTSLEFYHKDTIKYINEYLELNSFSERLAI